MLNIELPHLISTVMQSQWHCCYSLYLIIIHNIPRDFGGQWFLANLKFKSDCGLGNESFRRVHWPEHQAWHRCWLGLISCESESGVLRGQPGAWSSRHQHHERLLNAETQKSCSAFCQLDYYWGPIINEQPLFASLCPISRLYLSSASVLWQCCDIGNIACWW